MRNEWIAERDSNPVHAEKKLEMFLPLYVGPCQGWMWSGARNDQNLFFGRCTYLFTTDDGTFGNVQSRGASGLDVTVCGSHLPVGITPYKDAYLTSCGFSLWFTPIHWRSIYRTSHAWHNGKIMCGAVLAKLKMALQIDDSER